jgi:hypothetical protein
MFNRRWLYHPALIEGSGSGIDLGDMITSPSAECDHRLAQKIARTANYLIVS